MTTTKTRTRAKPPEEETNPGVLVTNWYDLKADYDEAVLELNELASKLNNLAGILRSKFSITVPTIGEYHEGFVSETIETPVDPNNPNYSPTPQEPVRVEDIRSEALLSMPDDMGSEEAFSNSIANVLSRAQEMIKF